MNRRDFSKKLFAFAVTSALVGSYSCTNNKKKVTFLIISGWQTVNIGDIAHTPGLLAFIDEFFPDAEYYLWPKDIEDNGVENMLVSNFPKLKIIKENYNKTDYSITQELKTVFDQCDILIHGSGPHVLEIEKLKTWMKHTKKPFGVCGVTEQKIYPDLANIIDRAAFFMTRETKSLEIIRQYKKSNEASCFFPDATFNLKLKNEYKAETFLSKTGLKKKEYICIVPRLRITPYYKIHSYIKWSEEKINEVNALNDQYKEIDHEKLRTVMIKWVRETGKKVLVCPEMQYQTEIMDELIINPLPEDVKSNVFKRDYWITDEAASTYKNAFAVISMECHSPIISYANNTPAFYIRQKEDTIKGQMYYDIGLEDWVFEIDETTGDQIYDRLKQIMNDASIAPKKIENAYTIINKQNQIAINMIHHALTIKHIGENKQ